MFDDCIPHHWTAAAGGFHYGLSFVRHWAELCGNVAISHAFWSILVPELSIFLSMQPGLGNLISMAGRPNMHKMWMDLVVAHWLRCGSTLMEKGDVCCKS